MTISVFGLLLGVAVLLVGYGRAGRRRRRRGFIIAGWTILGLQALGILIVVAPPLCARIDWIRYKPTAWLFPDIESEPWVWPHNGYHELVRRLETGKLSDKEVERLTQAALIQYSRTDKRIFSVEIRALNGLRKAGKLSAQQTDHFFQRLVSLDMKATPVVAEDEPTPVRIDVTPQGDWSDCGLWCVVSVTPVTTSQEQASGSSAAQWSASSVRFGHISYMHTDEIDGKVSQPLDGPILMRGPTFAWWQAEANMPGTEARELSCNVRIDYFDKEPVLAPPPKPVYTSTTRLSATSTVDSQGISAANQVVDPELAPELLGPGTDGGRLSHSSPRCQIACYLFDVVPSANGNMLRMSVHIYNAEVGFAFDASLTIDGTIHDGGTICHAEGESWEWILTAPYPNSEPETVDLTLTPNADLAASCVNLPRTWGKTITFKNVPRNRPITLKPYVVEHSWP